MFKVCMCLQINIGAEDEPEKKEISEDTAIDVQMIVRDLLSKRQYDAAIDVLNEKLGAVNPKCFSYIFFEFISSLVVY